MTIHSIRVDLPDSDYGNLATLAKEQDLTVTEYASVLLKSASRRRSVAKLPIGLTSSQTRLRDFLRHYSRENEGQSPTYDEMRAALSLKRKSGVSRLLDGLEQRNIIRRLPNRVRAITLLENA